jgi:hypothetical protein
MDDYDQFEADLEGVPLNEIERRWNVPADPFDTDKAPFDGEG